MKTDYLDDEYWVELARKRKVRLPQRATPLTTGGMESWVKKLGKDSKWWKDKAGDMSYKAYLLANPEWSMRAFVGVLLEWLTD